MKSILTIVGVFLQIACVSLSAVECRGFVHGGRKSARKSLVRNTFCSTGA